jgi:branched-chain amino acid transport system substrate-binding protein
MSYESTAEPIKIGYLMDFLLPDDYPQEKRDDLTIPFDMVFGDAFEQEQIDRPSRWCIARSRACRREP